MDVLDASRHSSLTAASLLVRPSLALALARPSSHITRTIPATITDMAATRHPTHSLPLRRVTCDNGNTAQLSADVQNLSNQVADLRDDVNSANSAGAPAPPGTSLSATEPAVATVFIFRDGLRVSGQNYAIAGPTLWVFQRTQRAEIPDG